jgi:hypothetical protein
MIANRMAAKALLYLMLGYAAAPAVAIGLGVVWLSLPLRFETHWVFEPRSQAFEQVAIDSSGRIARDDDLAESSRVTVTFTRNDGASFSRTAVYALDETEFQRQLAGPQTIASWMAEMGIRSSDAPSSFEAQEIGQQIMNAAYGGHSPGPPNEPRTLRLIAW